MTNGARWRVFKVKLLSPIEHECVVDVDLLSLNHRNKDDIEVLGIIAKEGWKRAKLDEYHEHKQALSKFTLGALVLSEPVIRLIRRELRRVVDVAVDEADVKAVLQEEVIKRDVLEGDKAVAAPKQVERSEGRALRKSVEKEAGASSADESDDANIMEAIAPTPVPQPAG